MTKLTEAEAKTKLCHMSFAGAMIRSCQASACMAWEIDESENGSKRITLHQVQLGFEKTDTPTLEEIKQALLTVKPKIEFSLVNINIQILKTHSIDSITERKPEGQFEICYMRDFKKAPQLGQCTAFINAHIEVEHV